MVNLLMEYTELAEMQGKWAGWNIIFNGKVGLKIIVIFF